MSNPEPNINRRASMIWNDPNLWPFVGLREGDNIDLNFVPEDTGVVDDQTGQAFTPQGPINDLTRFRLSFPFVPIIPFPPQVATVALVQNVAKDIVVPDGVVAVFLRGSGNYYVSNHGNAEVPVDGFSKSIYKPDGIMFYTGGIKTLSVITPDAGGCVVTMLGYAPTEWPRYER